MVSMVRLDVLDRCLGVYSFESFALGKGTIATLNLTEPKLT